MRHDRPRSAVAVMNAPPFAAHLFALLVRFATAVAVTLLVSVVWLAVT
jgi:hypothetical protein